ncbi:MAG: response regulator [Chitinophagales bacterium]
MKKINILVIENNLKDLAIIQDALNNEIVENTLTIIGESEEALHFLRESIKHDDKSARPDLIILNLDLNEDDGVFLLKEIKTRHNLKLIPTVALAHTASNVEILNTYNLHANCLISKPIDDANLRNVFKVISNFWFNVVQLPPVPTLQYA